MKSKDAILMAKLGKANPQLSTVSQENDGRDFRGIKDGVKDSGPGISAMSEAPVEMPTTKSGGSLEMLKAHKAGAIGGKIPTYMRGELPQSLTNDVEPMPVSKAYSPIKDYLKKGK